VQINAEDIFVTPCSKK